MRTPALLLIYCIGLLSCDAQNPGNRQADLDAFLEEHALQPIVGELPLAVDADEVNFLVAGHLYGSPGQQYKGRALPASSFTAHFDESGPQEADFLILTGDFVRALKEPFLSTTLEYLGKLGLPVFNAPGNHEIGGKRQRRLYSERWGRSYGGFRVGSSLFLVLDTELEPWKITGDQLAFLREALALAPAAGIKRSFVFAHRVLFATDDERYEVVFELANSKADWAGSNYASDILPILAAYASQSELTWFSGDVGGVARSFGLFHDYDERYGIRYIASGIGEQPSDNVVSVQVTGKGETQLERIPLQDPKMRSLEDCDLEAWQARSQWLSQRRAKREAEKGK